MGFSDTCQAMDKHPLSDLAALSKRLTAPTIKLLSFHAPEKLLFLLKALSYFEKILPLF